MLKKRLIDLAYENEAGYTPKEFRGILTDAKYNTIKSACIALKKGGVFEVYGRGIYRLVEKYRYRGFSKWKTHNNRLTCNVPEHIENNIPYNFDFIKDLTPYSLNFGIGKNSHKATMIIGCTKAPIQIDYSIVFSYLVFAQQVFIRTGFYPRPADVEVHGLELNQDFINVRFDGCLTIESLLSMIRLYYKEELECTRYEIKLKVPITAEVMMEVLNRASSTIDIYQKMHQTDVQQREILKKMNSFVRAIYTMKKTVNKILKFNKKFYDYEGF